MATINIEISQAEKDQLVKVIKKHQGKTMSVAAFAREANMNPNRARFVVDELLEEGRITRTLVKSFNTHYKRYSYTVN